MQLTHSLIHINDQIKDMRKTMEEDEQMKVIMAGFRGSNLDESDFALNSVKMTLVEVRPGRGCNK